MGSTAQPAPTSPAGVGNPSIDNPLAILRSLEAVRAPNGEYYLAVAGDPERFYAGFWDKPSGAEAHRDWLLDRRDRAPALDVNAHVAAIVKAHREAGDALAGAVAAEVINLLNCNASQSEHVVRLEANNSRMALCRAVDAYRKAVDHG